MRITIYLSLLILIFQNICCADLSNQSRSTTDALLVYESGFKDNMNRNNGVFKSVNASLATFPETGPPATFKQLWGKNDVFMIHPLNRNDPGSVDFSQITEQGKGTLRLLIHKHPDGNHKLEIMRAGRNVFSDHIFQEKWVPIDIPFDHQPITLNIIPTGWMFEWSFITYSIGPYQNSPTLPNIPVSNDYEIDASKTSDKENIRVNGFQKAERTEIQMNISLRRKNTSAPTENLKLHLFVFGKNLANELDTVHFTQTLNNIKLNDGNKYAAASENIVFLDRAGNNMSDREYRGFYIYLTDEAHNILAVRSTHPHFEELVKTYNPPIKNKTVRKVYIKKK
ncbi:hypothetical protein PDESU_00415 [Pontiella desulfatans]|uniref:Uncharacterized protein n=1 Tax=Pontiella desulfatans TaxID=2750659 RepID=A0A6C2TW25_PONDE|nr:hypothetical protein [Pontiella desulfatans]VGO11868.1 hypothetical protein PDESU_00415 [Pontiella desulfatans]